MPEINNELLLTDDEINQARAKTIGLPLICRQQHRDIAQAQLDKVLNQPWLDRPNSKGLWYKAEKLATGKWHMSTTLHRVTFLELTKYNMPHIKWQKAIVPEPLKE